MPPRPHLPAALKPDLARAHRPPDEQRTESNMPMWVIVTICAAVAGMSLAISRIGPLLPERPPNTDPRPQPPQPPVKVSLDAQTTFAFNDAAPRLAPDDRAQLDACARLRPLHRITVVGSTDCLGSATYNLQLSRDRADRIAQTLVAMGAPADKITAIGQGIEPASLPSCAGHPGHSPELIARLAHYRRVDVTCEPGAGTDDPPAG